MDYKDCKAIPGVSLATQHRLVVLDICIRGRKSGVINKMFLKRRWRDLKGVRATIFKDKVIDAGEWNFEAENTAMRNEMANYIKKVAKEVIGKSKGKSDNKETCGGV